jgi:outer membrane protein assembly factor BamB
MRIGMVIAGVMLYWSVTAAQADDSIQQRELVSPSLVSRAGWTWDWQIKLPVRSHETLNRMYVFDEYLYALTDTNMLFCMDRKTGAMRFVTSLSSNKLPVCPPAYFENKLWFLVGNEMVTVDPWAGSIVEKHSFAQIGNTFECGLAINENYIYITGSDRRLHAFSRDGYWRAFTATADNDSPIISLWASEDIVLFATEAGNIVSMSHDQALKIWQFDATGTIRSGLMISQGAAYIGSEDTKLYKLDLRSGRSAWTKPFSAGARLRNPVTFGKTLVYLPAGPMGVYGIDQNSGQAIWHVSDGIGILTETDKQSFVMSRPGILKVMDNKTGRQAYSVNFNQVTQFTAMMDEPKLYIADNSGRVASITVR